MIILKLVLINTYRFSRAFLFRSTRLIFVVFVIIVGYIFFCYSSGSLILKIAILVGLNELNLSNIYVENARICWFFFDVLEIYKFNTESSLRISTEVEIIFTVERNDFAHSIWITNMLLPNKDGWRKGEAKREMWCFDFKH